MKAQVSFGKQAQAYLQHYANLSERELFYYLINIDEFPSIGPRAQQLVAQYLERAQAALSDDNALPARLQGFRYTPDAFAERLAMLHQHQLTNAAARSEALTTDQLDYVLKQYAPSALIDGCWLQNISIAATNHGEIATQLFHIYTTKIGDGDTAKHYGNLYQNLLHSAQIYLPEVNIRLFTTQNEPNNHAFSSPVLQLALSLFPRVYLAELIGYTLGHFFDSHYSLLISLSESIKREQLDDRYCEPYRFSSQLSQDAQLIQQVVNLYLDEIADDGEREQHWQRIWHGLVMHHLSSEPWLQDLDDAVKNPRTLTPHQKMLALVRDKAPHARNMHRRRKLGGQLINDWFEQDPFDAEGFLKALAASPYVNLKAPLESALITRSVNFGGPMFRIFTDAELAVMTEWVQSLATETQQPVDADVNEIAPANEAVFTPIHDDNLAHPDLDTYAKCSKRELYYYFVNADLYPDILPTARKTAQRYFESAKTELDKRNCPAHLKHFPYSHDAFESHIREIYQSETGSYKNFEPPSKIPREIMVWFIQQYAPFPMVDGSWVQHIAKAGMSQTEISARLFRIYSDEVGNADTFMNHPNVYRRMLEGEGIHMPPTDSREFANQPELLDFSFDIPLLTMSISMFPRAFLPEIIGVNLAIELSGLGKSYMSTIDELKYWKIDPYFFTLHLTIDNIASGHTAVAMEAVHLYLDQILASQGQEAVQREWQRIWTGYVAFDRTMKRFDMTLDWQATIRFIMPMVRLWMQRGKSKKQRSTASA